MAAGARLADGREVVVQIEEDRLRDAAGRVGVAAEQRDLVERLAGEPEPPGSPPNVFPEHNAMGLHMVRAGFVALCIENPGTGHMSEPLVEDFRSLQSVFTNMSQGIVLGEDSVDNLVAIAGEELDDAL